MKNDTVPSQEAIAQSLIDDAPNYVKAVSAITESHEISAVADIVSPSGIKLVARGTKIDEHLFEKIAGHRLSGTTLEMSLSIADGVTPESLAKDISRLIDEDAWFKLLAEQSGDPAAMRHGASRLRIHPQVLFRLTVAREQRPELYRHALCVVLISHYLALRLSLKQSSIDSVLVAALCHDLGELYTDPAILAPGYRITDEQRRFIYVHPITGWLIVRELPGIGPEISKAVIQHQERLDGSGYPLGIRGDAIGQPGRILAAADISASIMMKFHDHRRLSTLLRLNGNKYDRKVVDLLHLAFNPKAPSTAKLESDVLKQRLIDFAELLEGWSQLRADARISQTVPIKFLTERMYNMRTVVLAFGFDPDSLEMPLQLAAEDATIATELAAVVDELQFQLADLGREIDRRESDWKDSLNSLAAIALTDWKQQLVKCIGG